MAEAQQPGRIGRSILAVIAGIVVALVPTLVSDAVMHALNYFPPAGQHTPDGSWVAAIAYRTAYGVLGAYVTARLAPRRPMKHVMVLGALGCLVCIAGLVATWNKGPEFGPHWYPLALVVLALPTSWAGGALREMQLTRRPQEI